MSYAWPTAQRNGDVFVQRGTCWGTGHTEAQCGVGLNSDTPVKEDINFSHNKGLMELPHAACGRVGEEGAVEGGKSGGLE